jgi:hypothetical protein
MPKTISASVGLHGRNLHDDTLTVQKLLNGVSEFLGGPNPKLVEDGIVGPKTRAAIQKFQLTHFGWHWADMRVDPDGPTLARLNELNPDSQPPPGPVTPTPEPLSTDFVVWLRFKGKFFNQPLTPDQFLFTVVDVTNNRDANYQFEFGRHAEIPPFPPTGSGGHMARIKPNKPSSVSTLAGEAVYSTTVVPGDGKPEDRVRSKLVLFPSSWLVNGSGTGFQMDFDAHLFQPRPNDAAATTIALPGKFVSL